MNLKPGDKVICLKSYNSVWSDSKLVSGQVYTVKRYFAKSPYEWWPDGTISVIESDFVIYPKNFKLVSDKPKRNLPSWF